MKLILMSIALLALCMPAWAQGPDEPEHAKARLICETKTLTPGQTAFLALHFDIDDHWHLYWNGVNDSGFAPKLNPKFPAGFEVGEIQWPAPKRLILPGDILDHIYENQVTLLIPVSIPADAKPGTAIEFNASPEWLVCHEVCLPGDAELKLSILVGNPDEPPQPGTQAALFAKARERVPKPLPKTNPPLTLTISRQDDKITIQAPGAAELAFYPGLDGVGFPNLIKEGQRKGDRLALSIKRQGDAPQKLRGVIEVKPQGAGKPTLWAVDVELESLNQSTPKPSDHPARPRGN